ncbi:MAG: MerR family transcriptional regulator [Clostridia bacterium]|nr:MerR family transcriptional regulator [Clostridia bacterium]
MKYIINKVSKISGVTIRTLQYYDKIGLLNPSEKTDSGYRIYNENDIEKLVQILFFKELGFRLHEIIKIVNSPKYNVKEAMSNQKQMLVVQRDRLNNMINIIEGYLNGKEMNLDMSIENKFKVMSKKEIDELQKQYVDEVNQKYDKDVVSECNKKVASYDNNKWKQVQEDSGKILIEIVENMDKPVEDPKIQNLVDAYRQHITDNFYNCTIEIFAGLGQMYLQDERFTKFYENIKEGLAEYLSKAIEYYCANKKQ